MDELKQKQLERGVIDKLKEQGSYQPAFDTIITIYADMLIQREILEGQAGNGPEGNTVLTDVLATLNQDIQAYEKRLGIL